MKLPPKIISAVLCVLFIVLFLATQAYTVLHRNDLVRYKGYALKHILGAGVANEYLTYTYGLYYWNKFPLFPQVKLLPIVLRNDNNFYSKLGARTIYENFGYTLKNDFNGLVREGVRTAYFLPYFTALLRGGPQLASFVPISAAYFLLACLMLIAIFWANGEKLIGVAMAFFMSSYPFQLYNTYLQENVFSYYISTFIIVMALLFFVILNRRIPFAAQIACVITAGFCIGFFYSVRNDSIAWLISATLVLLLSKHDRLIKRAALVLFLALSFILMGTLVDVAMDHKVKESVAICKAKGGDYLKGYTMPNHVFWFALYIYYEDLGTNGIHRTDITVEYFVSKIMKEKYGKDYGRSTFYKVQEDRPIVADPLFEKICRDMFFSDIKANPGLFIKVLVKRFCIMFTDAIPPRIILFGREIIFPYHWFVCLVVFVYVAVRKKGKYFRLLLLASGSALIPVFLSSKHNLPNMCILPITLYAVGLCMLIEYIWNKKRPHAMAQT